MSGYRFFLNRSSLSLYVSRAKTYENIPVKYPHVTFGHARASRSESTPSRSLYRFGSRRGRQIVFTNGWRWPAFVTRTPISDFADHERRTEREIRGRRGRTLVSGLYRAGQSVERRAQRLWRQDHNKHRSVPRHVK